MELFIQQLLAGLAVGGIYASLALALVMIYQATALVNFAQAEMAMFSTYIAWTLIQKGVPYWLAFFLTLCISFVGGVLIERLVIRPARNAPVLAIVIIFIGLLVILNSTAGWIWTYTNQIFPSPFPDRSIQGVNIQELGAIGVTLVVLALVFAFFRFTPLGLAMRAAAQNPTSSRLVGIRVGWMLALGWGLAAAIGASAGMMVAPKLQLDPNLMAPVLIYAFAGALVGGISSPHGAVIGGFAVGIIENMVGTYVPVVGSQLKLAVALALILGVLLIRPNGIFGKTIVKRV